MSLQIAALDTLQCCTTEAEKGVTFEGKKANFIFLSHEYEQHTCSERPRKHCILYHSYLISECHDPRYAVSFAYEDSISSGPASSAMSSKEGLHRQYGSLDGDTAIGDGSKKISNAAKSDRELCAFMLKAGDVPEGI